MDICLQNLLSLLNILHLNSIFLPQFVHVLGCFGGSCPTVFPLYSFYRPKDKWRNIIVNISQQRLPSPLLSHTSLHCTSRAAACLGCQTAFHSLTWSSSPTSSRKHRGLWFELTSLLQTPAASAGQNEPYCILCCMKLHLVCTSAL